MLSKQPSGNLAASASSTSSELPWTIAACATWARKPGRTTSITCGQLGKDAGGLPGFDFCTAGRYNRCALLLQVQMPKRNQAVLQLPGSSCHQGVITR